MSELGDSFKEWREHKQKVNDKRRSKNTSVLNDHMPPTEERNCGTVVLYRPPVYPISVDYYPGTNTWRSGGKTYHGNVESFMNWMNKRRKDKS